jgi:hypothetical protein
LKMGQAQLALLVVIAHRPLPHRFISRVGRSSNLSRAPQGCTNGVLASKRALAGSV